MHYLIRKAFTELYPEKESAFESKLNYSKAFKGYNAKVKYTKYTMEFRLSHAWKDVSDEIQVGLLQSLLNKVFGTGIKTMNIELYDIFLKKLPAMTPKTKSEPALEESFSRVNEGYFSGMMDSPNLEFGGENFHTLGTYDHGTDTIRISSVLLKDLQLLDYVMYHEMLHKRFKYKSTGKRTIHHSRQFREEEKKFRLDDADDKLREFLRREKRKEKLWFL